MITRLGLGFVGWGELLLPGAPLPPDRGNVAGNPKYGFWRREAAAGYLTDEQA